MLSIMKKIKLLTLCLLTLIWLGSFCNSSQLSVVYDSVSNTPATWTVSVNWNYVYCFYANYNTSTRKFNITYQWITVNVPISSNMICFSPDNNYNSFDYEFIGSSYNVLNYLRIYEAEICDYSDYVPVSDYNSCLSDLNIATWNYQTCQSSISWYVNSLNNCSSNLNSCSTSLSSCLSANCPNNTWNISRSALFINNIQHIWAPIIRMTIPEELSWDYAYTDSGNNMEIDIEGYNVDYDKINNIVDIQSYKPTDEDFSNIIWLLADYMPILIIFVWLLFIYKFLTKSFKSKL